MQGVEIVLGEQVGDASAAAHGASSHVFSSTAPPDASDVGARAPVDRLDQVLGLADDHVAVDRLEVVDGRLHLRGHAALRELSGGVQRPDLGRGQSGRGVGESE